MQETQTTCRLGGTGGIDVAQTYAEAMPEVRNAAVKLQRAVANGGVDPVSGYRDKDIAAYLRATARRWPCRPRT